MRLIVLLLLINLSFNQLASQTRIERRIQKDILKFKGNDSAWIAPTWGGTRFYLGNKGVSSVEFENTIKNHSPEIELLIKKVRQNHQIGMFFGFGGIGLMTASAFTIDQIRSTSYGEGRTVKTSTIVLFTSGIVASCIGFSYQLKARNRFIEGVNEFNKSVKAKSASAKVNVGVQPSGLGFSIQF